jgi:pimeloyl-ACP methyl ester carboxylesterase
LPLDVSRALPIGLPDRSHARPSRGWIALGLAGVGFGALAIASQLLAWRAERRYPPQGRFIVAEGVRLHYLERGEGRPLILLHGMGSLSADFATSVLDALAAEHRVIAFDRPGYGYSARPGRMAWAPGRQARLIHMAATRLGVERPIILGHSWGALVALAYALMYPQQTAAVVLLGGCFFPIERRELAIARLFNLPLLGALLRNTAAPFLARLLTPRLLAHLVFAPNPVPARFRREFPLELGYRPAQFRAFAEEAAMLSPEAAALSARYGEVAVPTVIVSGESDHLLPARDHALRLHRAIPHSVIKLLPRIGHMVHHNAPAVVRDAVALARQEVEAAS